MNPAGGCCGWTPRSGGHAPSGQAMPESSAMLRPTPGGHGGIGDRAGRGDGWGAGRAASATPRAGDDAAGPPGPGRGRILPQWRADPARGRPPAPLPAPHRRQSGDGCALPPPSNWSVPSRWRANCCPWTGARPCTPDMLPIIGPLPGQKGAWCAFGHAHQGADARPHHGPAARRDDVRRGAFPGPCAPSCGALLIAAPQQGR